MAPSPSNVTCPLGGSTHGGFFSGDNPLAVNFGDPIQLFILQALIIIVFTRLLEYPLSYLHQPRVIAEVIGGILLGPSALSRIPAFKDNVFPAMSLPFINLVANLGLVFYLFLVGLELDLKQVLRNARMTTTLSFAGIFPNFLPALGVAYALYAERLDTGKQFSFGVFYLFCSVSMAITVTKISNYRHFRCWRVSWLN